MPGTYLKPTPIIILLLSFSFILSCSTTKDKKLASPSKLLREAKRFYKVGDAERTKNNINIDKVIQTAASDFVKTDVTFTIKRND